MGAQHRTEQVVAIPDHHPCFSTGVNIKFWSFQLQFSHGFSGSQHQSAERISETVSCRLLPWLFPPCHWVGALHSSPVSGQHLCAKNTAGSQLSTPTNICCHKSVQKQDAPLTFNISVLGLLIHYESVINVTELQIWVTTLPGGLQIPSLPPTWHSRTLLPLQGDTLGLFSSSWVPSLISFKETCVPLLCLFPCLSHNMLEERYNDCNSQAP